MFADRKSQHRSLRAEITCKRMAGATLKTRNGESNNVTVKDTSPEARGATCFFDSTFKDFTNEMPVEVTMELMVICFWCQRIRSVFGGRWNVLEGESMRGREQDCF
jgi:hypothetical protein